MPAFPEGAEHVWAWFVEIDDGLPASGMAPVMLTWSELGEWSRLTRTEIEPWEARALVRIGASRAGAEAERLEKTGGSHDQD